MRVGIKGVAPPLESLFPSPAAAARGGERRPCARPRGRVPRPLRPVFAPRRPFSSRPSRPWLPPGPATGSRCGFARPLLPPELVSAPKFGGRLRLRSPSPAWPIAGRCLPSAGLASARSRLTSPLCCPGGARRQPAASLTPPAPPLPAAAAMSAHLQWMIVRNCSSFLIKRNKQTYSTVSAAGTRGAEGGTWGSRESPLPLHPPPAMRPPSPGTQ